LLGHEVKETRVMMMENTTPRANVICERFLGSARRECLDHVLIFHEKQLHGVLQSYVDYFNLARPHQGIHQQVPDREGICISPEYGTQSISVPVLGGLHHECRRATS
jgi:putative transposase